MPSFQEKIDRAKELKEIIFAQYAKSSNAMNMRDRIEIFENTYENIVEYFETVDNLREMPEYKMKRSELEEALGYLEVNNRVGSWLENRCDSRRYNDAFFEVFRDLKLDFYPGDNAADEEFFRRDNLSDEKGITTAEERLARISSKAEQMNSLMSKSESEILDTVKKHLPEENKEVIYGYLHAEALYRNRKFAEFSKKLNNAKEYTNTISIISDRNRNLKTMGEALSETIDLLADKGSFEKEDAQKIAEEYHIYKKGIADVEKLSRDLEEKTDRSVFFQQYSFEESFADGKVAMCDYLGKYADSLEEKSELRVAWNRQKELLNNGKDDTIMNEFGNFNIDENGLLYEDYQKIDKMLADLKAYKDEVQESIDKAKENNDVIWQTLLTASAEMRLSEITSKLDMISGKYNAFKAEVRVKYTSLLDNAAINWDKFEKSNREYSEAVIGSNGFKSFEEITSLLPEQEAEFRKCYRELDAFEKRYGFKKENRKNFNDKEIGDENRCDNLSKEYRKKELNRINELNAFNEKVATLDKELSNAKSRFGKENFVKIVTLAKEAEDMRNNLTPIYKKVTSWAMWSVVGEYKDERFGDNVTLLNRDIRRAQEFVEDYVKAYLTTEEMDSEIDEGIKTADKSLNSYDEEEYKKGKAKLAVLKDINERLDKIKESDEYKVVQNTIFNQAFDVLENMENRVRKAVSKGDSIVESKDVFFENAHKQEAQRIEDELRRKEAVEKAREEEARNREKEEEAVRENLLDNSMEESEDAEKVDEVEIPRFDAEKTNRILEEGVSERDTVYNWRVNYSLERFAGKINDVKQAYLSFKQENPENTKWDELFQNFDRRVNRMINDPMNAYGRYDVFTQKIMDFNRYENNSDVRESFAEYVDLLNGNPSLDSLERLHSLNEEFANYDKKYLERYKNRNQDELALQSIKNYLGLTEDEVNENLKFAGEISNSVSENQKKYDKYLDDCKKALNSVPEYKKWSSDAKALKKQLNEYKNERNAYSELKRKSGLSIEQDAKKIISFSEKYQDISDKFAEYKNSGKGLYSKFFADEKLVLPQNDIDSLRKSVLDKANGHFGKVLGVEKAKGFIGQCTTAKRNLDTLFSESRRFKSNKDYDRLAQALSNAQNSFVSLKESKDYKKLSSENKQITTVLLGLGNEKRYDAEVKNLRSTISKDIAEFSNDVILGWDDSLSKEAKLENAVDLLTSYSKASKMRESFEMTNPSAKELKAVAKYATSAQRLINEKMVPLVVENMEESMKKMYTTMNISDEEKKDIADSIKKQVNVLKNAGVPEAQYDFAEDFVNQYDAGERRKALAEEAKRLEEAEKSERERIDIGEEFEDEKDDVSFKSDDNLNDSKARESDEISSVHGGMREKSEDGKERVSIKDLFGERTLGGIRSLDKKDRGKDASKNRESSFNSFRKE